MGGGGATRNPPLNQPVHAIKEDECLYMYVAPCHSEVAIETLLLLIVLPSMCPSIRVQIAC